LIDYFLLFFWHLARFSITSQTHHHEIPFIPDNRQPLTELFAEPVGRIAQFDPATLFIIQHATFYLTSFDRFFLAVFLASARFSITSQTPDHGPCPLSFLTFTNP